MLDGSAVISAVLQRTLADVRVKEAAASAKNGKKRFKKDLSFAITFARHMSEFIAAGLRPDFPEVTFGEKPSRALGGLKRVDISYNTPQAGLGVGVSLKSVHFGEQQDRSADFKHNMKRNDEELRVEATGHHLRQPFAVLVAVVFLPLESCVDLKPTSSFASWVEYLWPLKGRDEPEDPPDRYELVFVALYSPAARVAAERSQNPELGFYHVGGPIRCPRYGRPKSLLTFAEFLRLINKTFDHRNGKDFAFEGEDPGA